MSLATAKVLPAPVQLLRVAVCAGYFPGMKQPALRAEFARPKAGQGSVIPAHIEQVVASIIPEFSARELPGSGGAVPLVSLVAVLYEALLSKAGIPLLCTSCVAPSHSSADALVVYLPLLDRGIYGPHLEGLRWAVRLVNLLLKKGDANTLAPELGNILGQLSAVAPSGMNSRRFIEEASIQGVPWKWIAGNVYRFGFGARARLFDSSFTDKTPLIGTQLARDKRLTAQLLNASGFPGARHQQAQDEETAVKIALQLGYPVVVKPADADGGRGVAPGLVNEDMVRKAFAQARAVSSQVLVEKHFDGKDYRLQVLDDHVYWIVNRVPGGVMGDGVHTVMELLATVNADPRRGPRGSNSLLKIIDVDEEALEMLADVQLGPDSVPDAGQFVRLRRAANVASGGVPVPAMEGAHRDNIELAIRAARLLRLDVAGIDLIIPDIRDSWLESGALICEINAQPQLSPTLPAYLLQNLVAANGRVPVTVILGGAPDWVRRGEQQLNASDCRVGALWPDGVHIAGHRVTGVPASAFQGCEVIFNDPGVDQILLCLSDDQLMNTGFPVDGFDRLVLVEPQSSLDDTAWAKLHDCAVFLAELCDGEVLLDGNCQGWRPVLERMPRNKVSMVDNAELSLDPLSHLFGVIN